MDYGNADILPGSDDAMIHGCTCPRIDNHYGKGRYGSGEMYGWFINELCSVHTVIMGQSK